MTAARQTARNDICMVLTDDPTELALGLPAIITGPEPPNDFAGPSVGDRNDIRLSRIPDDIVGMKAMIAVIEMPVGPDKGRGIDVQPITDGATGQFSRIGVTEQNRLCRIIETQLIEMFMGAP